jgi:hypothetical protein
LSAGCAIWDLLREIFVETAIMITMVVLVVISILWGNLNLCEKQVALPVDMPSWNSTFLLYLRPHPLHDHSHGCSCNCFLVDTSSRYVCRGGGSRVQKSAWRMVTWWWKGITLLLN